MSSQQFHFLRIAPKWHWPGSKFLQCKGTRLWIFSCPFSPWWDMTKSNQEFQQVPPKWSWCKDLRKGLLRSKTIHSTPWWQSSNKSRCWENVWQVWKFARHLASFHLWFRFDFAWKCFSVTVSENSCPFWKIFLGHFGHLFSHAITCEMSKCCAPTEFWSILRFLGTFEFYAIALKVLRNIVWPFIFTCNDWHNLEMFRSNCVEFWSIFF